MDFEGNDLKILLNPRMGEDARTSIQNLLLKNVSKELAGHIVVASSGSTKKETEDFKLIALSRHAVLSSAAAVNRHLNAGKQDVWLKGLPLFHVGGLGILARAYLTGSKVVELVKWDPALFCSLMEAHLVTFTSLVPAQVYDLCQQQLRAPKALRGVIVGGGALSEEQYLAAKSLGWPLLPSYGLTECASQVATSDNNSSDLKLLSHIEARLNDAGYLEIKSDALLSYEVRIVKSEIRLSDPKRDGWLRTEDAASLKGECVTIIGRAADFIKIGGEGVLFSTLEKRLEAIRLKLGVTSDAALLAVPDERLGLVIHLAAVNPDSASLVEAFNASSMPYERIRHTHHVPHIPRSPLNKLLRHALLKLVYPMPSL